MFIPLALGVLMSAACAPFVNKHYLSVSAQYNGKPPAEKRLIPMMFSCWFIPVGLFIFAWTSYPRIHWIGPAIGGWPVGFGFIFLYNSANNYLGWFLPQSFSSIISQANLQKWIPINTKLPLPSRPKPSCVPCGVPPRFSLPSRCTSDWDTSGLVPCWRSLRWLAVLSRTSSTSKGSRSGGTPGSHLVMTRRRAGRLEFNQST